MRKLLVLVSIVFGCSDEVKQQHPHERAAAVVLGKSIVLDRDQPLICVYFHDKNMIVCLPPEEAFQGSKSDSQML